jgi:hypothetical protein
LLRLPQSVTCSAFDELVVGDTGNRRVCVFSGVGEVLMRFGDHLFRGVTIHDGALFASDTAERVVVEIS